MCTKCVSAHFVNGLAWLNFLEDHSISSYIVFPLDNTGKVTNTHKNKTMFVGLTHDAPVI